MKLDGIDLGTVCEVVNSQLCCAERIVKITETIGGVSKTEYDIITAEDLYEFLDNLIQKSDCKNGCEWKPKKHRFIINGSLWTKEDGDCGMNTVEVRFRSNKTAYDMADFNDIEEWGIRSLALSGAYKLGKDL